MWAPLKRLTAGRLDDNGGFEALRLIGFVFRGLVELWRSNPLFAVAREGVSVAPLGLGFHSRTEPSAHALGYHLSALRAWSHGLGAMVMWSFVVLASVRGVRLARTGTAVFCVFLRFLRPSSCN